MAVKLTRKRVYLGANLFADVPMLHAVVAIDPPANAAAWEPRMVDDVVRRVFDPATRSHSQLTGWLEETRRPQPSSASDYALHAVLRLAVLLQNIVGAELDAGQCIARPRDSEVDLLLVYDTVPVAWDALTLALRLFGIARQQPVAGGLEQQVESLRKAIGRFLVYAPNYLLDQTTATIARVARGRGIPCHRLRPESRYLRLGQGRHQRRILESYTDATGALATRIARAKHLSNVFLGDAGVPVPRQRRVATMNQLVSAAREIGFPVVVKPSSSGKGRGVTPFVPDETVLAHAFERAAKIGGDGIIVESFVEGEEHRILVVNDEVIAAARREPARVVGDGSSSIRALVEMENRDERRGDGFNRVLTRITLDSEVERVLRGQGLHLDAVPERGAVVQLRRTANISTGGTGTDVTDVMHPDVVEMARDAAAAVGLDIAGIDYISPDIGRSYREVGGAVIEINQCPGLRPHWSADGGRRDVVGPIVDYLFPPSVPYRVPVVLVTGPTSAAVAALVAELLGRCGRVVGLANADGVFVGGRQRHGVVPGTGEAAQWLLNQPTVEIAVVQMARRELVQAGIGVDRCDVACITGIERGEGEPDGLKAPESLLLRVTRGAVALNADDAGNALLDAAEFHDIDRVCFGIDAESPLLVDHRAAGGAVLYPAADAGYAVVLVRGDSLRRYTFRQLGLVDSHPEMSVVVATLATLVGLGINPDDVLIAPKGNEP